MTRTSTHKLLCMTIVAAGLGLGTTAHAGKRLSLRLHNDTTSTAMTCRVHKVVTNTSGTDVETLLRTFSVKPRNQRASSVAHRPQNFSMSVNYIIKRLDGSVVYPRLKLTCELSEANTRISSPIWDPADKSLSRYRFVGNCRSGAYCSARVARK
ncbi:MAG: hypothetical protein AAF721_42140 [Myxococcota bacterium]